MKKLLIVALAGAFLAPAAVTQAKPLHFAPAKRLKVVKRAPHRAHRTPQLIRRCHMPRVSPRLEVRRLRHTGFRRVSYQGKKVFLPRCAQFLYFTACKRGLKFKVIVRYIRHSRYVITLRQGRCLAFNPAPPPSRRPGA